jgi:antitoxin (DNA-binding transcriptional repressor) of toxin-antitoxin stability system
MKTLEMVQATASLRDYAQHVGQEPVILTVDGKPFAALVSIENMDWETVTLSNSPQFLALIEHSRARHTTEGGLSSTEMRRRLGIKSKQRRVSTRS